MLAPLLCGHGAASPILCATLALRLRGCETASAAPSCRRGAKAARYDAGMNAERTSVLVAASGVHPAPVRAAAQSAPRVLEVGCGPAKAEGAVGLDKLDMPGVDIVHDMERLPWPIADECFDEVRCLHVLEHVDDICGVMDELHRITRPGGRVRIVVPYFARYSAFKDPTHRRFCTFESFNYFVAGTEERDRSYSRNEFRYVQRELRFPSGWRGTVGAWLLARNHRRYERKWARTFPARTMEVVLEPVKPASARASAP
jgi:SAM-dependent methyltransferase